ncbi:hypothetical protein [Sphaerotilus mobilis]|uniref:Uncharacterized protein n=1 Tax=Sphaerotilus mobilis TaxID=47994 RepID=A0A4Q7LFB8_9BURK|nr:hypothetical protein [Sphaerotilus mobilis]RZS52287.1 hypothetical protein EV685_3479 [Sphaerotilus mobilis]
MTPNRLEQVFARTRSGQVQVLRTERVTTLAQHLLMRFNGYSPLAMLVRGDEQTQALAALDELLAQGWIEAVVADEGAPTESQWGSIGALDPTT